VLRYLDSPKLQILRQADEFVDKEYPDHVDDENFDEGYRQLRSEETSPSVRRPCVELAHEADHEHSRERP
jgi:hypothetical protein